MAAGLSRADGPGPVCKAVLEEYKGIKIPVVPSCGHVLGLEDVGHPDSACLTCGSVPTEGKIDAIALNLLKLARAGKERELREEFIDCISLGRMVSPGRMYPCFHRVDLVGFRMLRGASCPLCRERIHLIESDTQWRAIIQKAFKPSLLTSDGGDTWMLEAPSHWEKVVELSPDESEIPSIFLNILIGKLKEGEYVFLGGISEGKVLKAVRFLKKYKLPDDLLCSPVISISSRKKAEIRTLVKAVMSEHDMSDGLRATLSAFVRELS